MPKLRVGLIVDDGPQPEWIRTLVETSRQASYHAIAVLIIQKRTASAKSRRLNGMIEYVRHHGMVPSIETLAFRGLFNFERVMVSRKALYKGYFRRCTTDSLSIPKLYVDPIVSKSGLVYRYTAYDLDQIRQQGLDVLLHGGSGTFAGDVLDVCPFGVFSFHYADGDVNRGTPPAFWEVYNREPATGFAINRLSGDPGAGEILVKGAIPTHPVFMCNRIKLYRKSVAYMHKLLEDVGRTRRLPKGRSRRLYPYPLYATPTLGKQSRYLIQTASRKMQRIADRLTGKSWRWGVAYQFTSDWQSAALWKSTIIRNPPNRFLADPFVCHKDGLNVCFVEDYDYRTNKGRIAAFRIDKRGHEELGIVLDEPFHLSYPYLFEADGGLFMCPEASASREIRIYKCLEFPMKWALYKVLMRDVTAVDTNIFPFGGKWWMSTSIDTCGVHEHNSELHLFYADTFDSDKWRAHPLNPIVFDSRQARNGGLITDKNAIYRVFQVQGFNMYGESLGVARIKDLSVDHYAEEIISSIPPKFFPGISGTHTLSYSGGLLAVDYVRHEYHRF